MATSARIVKPALTLAKGSSYYLSGRLSVGAYVKDKNMVLIDSGIDDSSARDLKKLALSSGCVISAIINTHSHADHCGGNNYLQKAFPKVRVFATQYEKAFIENPYLEPVCFCGGAQPFSQLRNKHLEAKPSAVTDIIHSYKDQDITIDGSTFKIVTLPGHTPGMIGVVTPDNILYCGDAIFGDETFTKHGVLFYTDIDSTLKSFEKLGAMSIDGCVFYHGGYTPNIQATVKKHAQKVNDTMAFTLSLLGTTVSPSVDSLTQRVMAEYKIPDDVMRFTLTRTCVNAYVTKLQDDKKMSLQVKDGLLQACLPTFDAKDRKDKGTTASSTSSSSAAAASLTGRASATSAAKDRKSAGTTASSTSSPPSAAASLTGGASATKDQKDRKSTGTTAGSTSSSSAAAASAASPTPAMGATTGLSAGMWGGSTFKQQDQSQQLNGIKMFEVDNTEQKASQLTYKFYFKKKLSGEMHADHEHLTAITSIANSLKLHNLVANQPTSVSFARQGSCLGYKATTQLNYKGEMVKATSPAQCSLSGHVTEDSLSFSIVGNISRDYQEKLERMLTNKLGLLKQPSIEKTHRL